MSGDEKEVAVDWSDVAPPRTKDTEWAIAQGVEFGSSVAPAPGTGGHPAYERGESDGAIGAFRLAGWVMMLGGIVAIAFGVTADSSASGLGDIVNLEKLYQKEMATMIGSAFFVAGIVSLATASIINVLDAVRASICDGRR